MSCKVNVYSTLYVRKSLAYKIKIENLTCKKSETKICLYHIFKRCAFETLILKQVFLCILFYFYDVWHSSKNTADYE